MPTLALSSSFSEIFEQHVGFVWRVLRYAGVSERELPDVAQEVFIVIHRRLAEHDPARSAMRTWVFGIAQNVARNHLRLARFGREVPVADPPEIIDCEGAPDAAIDRERARALVTSVVNRLDEDQRVVFVLHDLEEVPMREITESLGLALPTGYSRLRLARVKVNAWLLEATKGRVP